MNTRVLQSPRSLGSSSAFIFAANDRMNQILIEQLDPAAWDARLSTGPHGGVRTVAGVFTHMHNVRTKWIRLTAPHLKTPAQLNRLHCTPVQASTALAQSAELCVAMLNEALEGTSDRIKTFRRDNWGSAWPVGIEMLCYMLTHEAHHRGQVCMLAHQLGFPLSRQTTARLWNWDRLWKDSGAPAGPGR